MAEREEAAVPKDDVEGEGKEREAEDVERQHRVDEPRQEQQHQHQDAASQPAQWAVHRPSGRPKSPVGRRSRTPAMRMKMSVLAMGG